LTVEVWGGGGSGGSAINDPNPETAGGGGGGGAYSRSTFAVIPGDYTVIVGDAGNPGYPPGGDSYMNDPNRTVKVLAKGGAGVTGNDQDGVSGGLASSGIGDTKFSGGAGADGNTVGNRGGGGGSSAGTGSDGNDGTGATGGTAPAGGVVGGNGSIGNGVGTNGSVPGGGGGGAFRIKADGGAYQGGNGAKGQVKITWSCPVASISYSSSFFYTEVSSAKVTLTGSTGGTFSAVPSGLSIDDLTGEINPSTSASGYYTVHYQIAAAFDCAAVDATAAVTIVGPPTGPASVTYCASEEKTVKSSMDNPDGTAEKVPPVEPVKVTLAEDTSV